MNPVIKNLFSAPLISNKVTVVGLAAVALGLLYYGIKKRHQSEVQPKNKAIVQAFCHSKFPPPVPEIMASFVGFNALNTVSRGCRQFNSENDGEISR